MTIGGLEKGILQLTNVEQHNMGLRPTRSIERRDRHVCLFVCAVLGAGRGGAVRRKILCDGAENAGVVVVCECAESWLVQWGVGT